MEKKLPESLQKLIKKVEEAFPEDPRMVQLFINCFTNTLDTTVKRLEDGTTYRGYTGYVAAGQCGADPALSHGGGRG